MHSGDFNSSGGDVHWRAGECEFFRRKMKVSREHVRFSLGKTRFRRNDATAHPQAKSGLKKICIFGIQDVVTELYELQRVWVLGCGAVRCAVRCGAVWCGAANRRIQLDIRP